MTTISICSLASHLTVVAASKSTAPLLEFNGRKTAVEPKVVVDRLLSRKWDGIQMKLVYPLSEVDSKYLMISSCFFLLPGFYALSHGLTLYFATSAVTTVASINYWRDAVPGWRRTSDMIIAKVSFLIYFLTGLYRIKDAAILYLAWPICFLIIYCYMSSNRLWKLDSHLWIFSHMCFHYFVAVEQYIVLVGSFWANRFWAQQCPPCGHNARRHQISSKCRNHWTTYLCEWSASCNSQGIAVAGSVDCFLTEEVHFIGRGPIGLYYWEISEMRV